MNKEVRMALLPSCPDIKALGGLMEDYAQIINEPVKIILDRYDKNPEYGWINTKFDLLTGEDFPLTDPVYGVDTIYSWIQGRALETLSENAIWMGICGGKVAGYASTLT